MTKFYFLIFLLCCSCLNNIEVSLRNDSSGGSGDLGNTSVEIVVEALYPNFGQGWFDHLQNTSANYYTAADDQICNLADTELHHCIHGGQIRQVRINNTNNCEGVTATDSLGAFSWYCFEKVDHIILASKLKSAKGLSDLIDANSWLNNAVIVKRRGSEIAYSEPARWWNETITPAMTNSTSIVELSTAGIYTLSSDLNSGGYRVSADNVALVGLGTNAPILTYNASGNECDSSGGSGATDSCLLVIPTGRQQVWIEHLELAGVSSVNLPLYAQGLSKAHFRKITVNNPSQHSFILSGGVSSKFIWIDTFRADGGTGNGINLSSSVSAARISNFSLTNMNNGVFLAGADNVILGPGSISRCASEGVSSPSTSLGITMYGLNVNNNTGALNEQGSATNHDMTIVQSQFTNNDRGTSGAIRFEGAGSIVFSHNIVANNTNDGIYTNIASYSLVMSNTLLMNNLDSGYEGTGGTIQRFHNIGAFNNGGFGIGSYYSADVILSGQLIFNGNGSNNCGNFAGGSGVSGNCTQSGTDNSNTYSAGTHSAVYRNNRDVKLSFLGVAGTDSINNTSGVLSNSRVASNAITDWINFENSFRSFSLMGATSDFLTSDEWGFCDPLSAVSCDIQDTSLLNVANTGNTVLLNQSGNFTTSDNQVNGDFVEGTICPTAIHGDQTLSDEFTSSRYFLAQAIEILDDGSGDDNGLCNSNERCIYAPNIGRYQGHGDYLTAGTCNFVDGVTPNAVSAVQMYAYSINGY